MRNRLLAAIRWRWRTRGAGRMAAKVPWLGGWLDRWYSYRDHRIASPRFQKGAADFLFTRPVARANTRALFDLCAGFVYSQVLLACVRTRLCEILLEDGPQSVEALAPRLELPRKGCDRLLRAAVALRLAERRSGGRFGVGPLGAALAGNPAIGAMIEHHTMLYADLEDPLPLLRGEIEETALARHWPYAGSDAPGELDADRVADYSALMAASQTFIADEVLAAYPMYAHRRLLDIGGGEGVFLSAAAARNPKLELMLFDLPPVAERARQRFEAAGLGDRATAVGGDFLRDPLPKGADIVSLVRVLHDHNDDDALTLLKAIREALPQDGVLVIAEPMAETPGAEPAGDAYFGFYLLAMGRGRPRSAAEITAMLTEAGFDGPRPFPTRIPLLTRVIVARSWAP